ncbi:LPS-assembly protein LptD [Sulfuriflexus sp.]|uniref:LPS-assembly protein LptD n=1 Tax=Sulfuriflexus sp. TaxID=2015443 RepID=UPI0028CF7808|nr:LPS assembly protein LptD [Sulfuriflexus sp.]MDT8403344.1 LPS assembly protein LptD [Sulfuriflexus sp.]
MKNTHKLFSALLGAGLVILHSPVVHAARSTGWDCQKTPAGLWECNPDETLPAAAPAPATTAPIQGPVTPPITALPVADEPEPAQQTEAEADQATSTEQTPASSEAETVAAPTAEPEPRPTPPADTSNAAETAAEQPVPEPAPETEPRPAALASKPQTALSTTRPVAVADKQATDTPELCPVQPRPPRIPVPAEGRASAELHLSADEADVAKEGVSHFRGNVEIRRADQHLNADNIDYDRDKELLLARGNVSLYDNELRIDGETARVDLNADQGVVEKADFLLYERQGRGTAEKIRRDGAGNKTQLDVTTYTTCPPGNEDWQLKADKIKLDHNEGVGTARDVSVRFKGIPFFYSPWLTFPIDDRRKTGFLTPSFGSSDDDGFEIIAPYYWNIAPYRDATLTPRFMGKRGLQLAGEYRFLNKDNEGQFNAELLPSDDLYNDDRYLFAYRNQVRFTPRLTANADLNYVSDDEYFEDLGTDISLTSQTHLNRYVNVNYYGDFWNVSGLLQGYETVGNAAQPYERLPQVLFNMNLPDQHGGLDYGLRAEAVQFEHSSNATGTRIDIEPSVSLPLQNNYGFITPKFALRHTRYNLDDVATAIDDNPDRTVPIFSIDSGLFFERDMSWGDRNLLQTLEPRLYYLNVAHRNQDNLIVNEAGQDVVFDSGLFDFSFSQLFRENRFSGADRIGDTNQLTAALTTRIIDQNSGLERLSASIGQIYYFEDRKVNLPGVADQTENSSDVVAEVSARLTRNWSARAGGQWDVHDSVTEKSVFSTRYQPDADRVFNLAYRHRRGLLEQVDTSVSWPVNRQWNVVGRWNYALDRSRTIDAFAGFEYESCCWIGRVVARQFINDLDQEDENFAILFQLELKGLTSFGDKVNKLIGEGVLGYGRDTFTDEF